jgi:hypothetical protein
MSGASKSSHVCVDELVIKCTIRRRPQSPSSPAAMSMRIGMSNPTACGDKARRFRGALKTLATEAGLFPTLGSGSRRARRQRCPAGIRHRRCGWWRRDQISEVADGWLRSQGIRGGSPWHHTLGTINVFARSLASRGGWNAPGRSSGRTRTPCGSHGWNGASRHSTHRHFRAARRLRSDSRAIAAVD